MVRILSTTLTPEIFVALCLLVLTVTLFVTEVFRIDVAALIVLVALGFSSAIPGVDPILPPELIFEGFASNAVMAIIATMIIGTGLDRSGTMSHVAGWILVRGKNNERRIVTMLAGSAALMSGFVQNIGAAALFLPVTDRVARLSGLPISRLLMPVGFCVMMGGSLTLVGSSSLVMLNDLIVSSNKSLPIDKQLKQFHLFEVAPVGIALTLTGILFFVLLGRFLLPKNNQAVRRRTTRTHEYFKEVYGLSGELHALQVTMESPLVGMTVLQIERTLASAPAILALKIDDQITVVPNGKQAIWVDSYLGVMCTKRELIRFARKYKLRIVKHDNIFASVLNAQETGVAEIVIPPGSSLVGQTLTECRMQRDDGLNALAVYRAGSILDEGFRETPLQGGDTLVVHTAWADLKELRNNSDYAIVTDRLDDELRPGKLRQALFFFVASMLLVLFSDFPIAVSLLFGAVGMVVSGVISMDEAYHAVSWKTVFLLGSLIPLGHAFETSGAATWIASLALQWLRDVPAWEIQVVIALMATVFSLFMSNVGATVLLVPLSVNIAVATDANPAMFALTVAIATSNSFLLPTHQVNALIMGPGGYRVGDFLKAGSVMTVLYLAVSIAVLNLMY